MQEIISILGLWTWVIIGLILLFAELMIPGVFIVWFGFAALVTAAIAGLIGDHIGLGDWQGQIILFLALSVIFVLSGRRYFRREPASDEPLLNQRTEQLIGEIATLEEPIKDGHGRVRINDTIWRIKGPDLAIGKRIRLIAFHDGAFNVEEA